MATADREEVPRALHVGAEGFDPGFYEDVDEELGGRLDFFNEPQKSDKYLNLRARRMPAVVVALWDDQRTPMVFGDWEDDSPCRFRANLMSQYMLFDINVRFSAPAWAPEYSPVARGHSLVRPRDCRCHGAAHL